MAVEVLNGGAEQRGRSGGCEYFRWRRLTQGRAQTDVLTPAKHHSRSIVAGEEELRAWRVRDGDSERMAGSSGLMMNNAVGGDSGVGGHARDQDADETWLFCMKKMTQCVLRHKEKKWAGPGLLCSPIFTIHTSSFYYNNNFTLYIIIITWYL